jgi:hypothetical protein
MTKNLWKRRHWCPQEIWTQGSMQEETDSASAMGDISDSHIVGGTGVEMTQFWDRHQYSSYLLEVWPDKSNSETR